MSKSTAVRAARLARRKRTAKGMMFPIGLKDWSRFEALANSGRIAALAKKGIQSQVLIEK